MSTFLMLVGVALLAFISLQLQTILSNLNYFWQERLTEKEKENGSPLE